MKMDSFNYDDHNMETDQEANAIARDIRLRSMGKTFRTIELCIALFFILWVILRLPFAVRIFSELFRQFFLLLLTPLIIFVLFGIGVGALMVKSYRDSAQNIAEDNVGTNFYEHMVNMPMYEDKEIVVNNDCDRAKTPIAATCDIPDEVDKYSDSETETGTECIMEDDDVVLEKKYNSSPRDLLNDADFKKLLTHSLKGSTSFLSSRIALIIMEKQKRTCIAIRLANLNISHTML